MSIRAIRLATILLSTFVSTCAMSDLAQLQAIDRPVDLQRFMGDWYVLGSIPIDFWFASEAGAHNGVESYALRDDGKIQTTYTFRRDGFNGEEIQFNPVAWVDNTETNAEWRMQFLWPFRSAYLIAYLDDDYQHTVIGVPNRSNVWIMSRRPDISEDGYASLLDIVAELGHDISLVQRVPQQWSEQSRTER
jgi:apolipoprotein D and lipocalin family protein